MDNLRLLAIIIVVVYCIVAMIRKKMSTIIALPVMGLLVAFIATVGLADGSLGGLYSHPNIYGTIDETTGEVMFQQGIMDGVLGEGAKMMSSAIVSAVFGGALAVLLKKIGVVEEIVKTIAELVGDRPLMIGLAFYFVTTLVFAAIGGLGPVILIGSVALPIMMSAGIQPRDAGAIILLGLSTGGVINPANWATYTTILESAGVEHNEAYQTIVNMSFMIFLIVLVISALFVVYAVRSTTYSRAWVKVDIERKKLSKMLLIAPIVPIIIIFGSLVVTKISPSAELVSPELAILVGIIYAAVLSGKKNKGQLITASFVQGVQEVSGAIVLLMGLGILIKGFQYYTVTPLIVPATQVLVEALRNPWLYVVGFTIATPLVLYRGPLNTFGIGGSIPSIFAAAGFSPLASIYALRAVGNLQGFGDPTNSQNIWVADFVKVDPNEITKRVITIGFVMSFAVLLFAVLTHPEMLNTL